MFLKAYLSNIHGPVPLSMLKPSWLPRTIVTLESLSTLVFNSVEYMLEIILCIVSIVVWFFSTSPFRMFSKLYPLLIYLVVVEFISS